MIGRRVVLAGCAASFAALCLSCGSAKESAKAEPAPAEFKARLQTTKGDVVVLVHRDWSPIGADHFYELTKMGFFNDNAFFRTVPGFIVQWGMNGDPKVNKDWSVITIKDDPPKVSNKVGTIVFAKTGEPNSRSTQLFINLGDNSGSLDSRVFAIWRSDPRYGQRHENRHGIRRAAKSGRHRRYWCALSRRALPAAGLRQKNHHNPLMVVNSNKLVEFSWKLVWR